MSTTKLIGFTIILLLGLQSANLKPKKVIFFGDSITEAGVQPGGYIDLLNVKLKDKKQENNYNLIGSGIGGNKIYDLLFRMDKDVLAQNPDIVVIWVGVNDVWHKTSFGTGTDANKFHDFYTHIVQRFQSQGIKVYCCTPACIGEKVDFSNTQDGDLNAYSNIIRNITKETQSGLIDFRKTFLEHNIKNNIENKPSGTLTSDGVHLNEKGNAMVAEILYESIFSH
jgi:lysophospholipase L1-like esterase